MIRTSVVGVVLLMAAMGYGAPDHPPPQGSYQQPPTHQPSYHPPPPQVSYNTPPIQPSYGVPEPSCKVVTKVMTKDVQATKWHNKYKHKQVPSMVYNSIVETVIIPKTVILYSTMVAYKDGATKTNTKVL
ncbi:unnamed protein product, partial [Meganyctiphanes norvegica]